MVDHALHGVLHDILLEVSHQGLRGKHHFFITFLTAHPEVKIPAYLKKEFPDEITIVLQHQFENLMVSKKMFSVDLYFNDKLENIKVPFSAILSFLDPSVNWGLNFEPELSDFSHAETPADDGQEKTPQLKAEKKGVVISLDNFRKK